jgi:hypothetical protein
MRVQIVTISGPKVKWERMGTWRMVDNQPEPPTLDKYVAENGWKMVTGLTVCKNGGDFLIPEDQILAVSTPAHHAHHTISVPLT